MSVRLVLIGFALATLVIGPADGRQPGVRNDPDDTRGPLDIRSLAVSVSADHETITQTIRTHDSWSLRDLSRRSFLMIEHDVDDDSAPDRRVVIYRVRRHLRSNLEKYETSDAGASVTVIGHPPVRRMSRRSVRVKLRTRRLGADVSRDTLRARSLLEDKSDRRCKPSKPCIDLTRRLTIDL
jgi:hypothetical protein